MPNQKKYWKANSLMAFFGGLFGASILFIIFYLLFDIAHLKSPFPSTPLGSFLHILIINSFIEEGAKFLLIKRGIGKYPYGFLLGLGFGTGEAILVQPFWQSKAILQGRVFATSLHIITAGIICYFIKKNKSLLGLLIAIILHTGYDLLVNWSNA